jgi:hypothetical protein
MVDTQYLLDMSMTKSVNDEKTTILRTPKPLHQRFRAAARTEGMDVSNMLRQFMSQTILRVKAQQPDEYEANLKAIQLEDEGRESGKQSDSVAVPVRQLADERAPKKKRA